MAKFSAGKIVRFSLPMAIILGILFVFTVIRTTPAKRILKALGLFKVESEVTQTITHSLLEMKATRGDELVLANIRSIETISHEESTKLAGVSLPGGTGTVRIEVPATFRFYVRLSEGVEVSVTTHGDITRCTVTAPPLIPQLPVTFDTTGMRITSDSSKLNKFFDPLNVYSSNTRQLEREALGSITSRLNESAAKFKPLARGEARKAFAHFVRDWLVKDDLWGRDGITEVVVLFADEVAPQGTYIESAPLRFHD